MKSSIRKSALDRRSSIPSDEHRQRSAEAVKEILSLPAYQGADAVMAYTPIRKEVDVGSLLARVVDDGLRLYLPRVNRRTQMIEAVRVLDLRRDLEEGVLGIAEPATHLQPEDLTHLSGRGLIIVPGVAFDSRGYRIGYGAGYYDRFLAALDRSGSVVSTVGVCFFEQLVPVVPRDEWDWPVQKVLAV